MNFPCTRVNHRPTSKIIDSWLVFSPLFTLLLALPAPPPILFKANPRHCILQRPSYACRLLTHWSTALARAKEPTGLIIALCENSFPCFRLNEPFFVLLERIH